MSDYTEKLTLSRINSAPENSPIAVFRCEREGYVQAIFASTIEGQKRIKTDPGLIGVFHQGSNKKATYAAIKNAVA
jgi:hypothetical protein